MTSSVEDWVDEVARTTRPDRVVWCDGSDAENDRLVDEMASDGTLIRLNQDAFPNSFLHRSNPQDVARTEHLTYICSEKAEDAGQDAITRVRDAATHAIDSATDAAANRVRATATQVVEAATEAATDTLKGELGGPSKT